MFFFSFFLFFYSPWFQYIDENQFPFQCDDCSRRYQHFASLKRHRRFQCDGIPQQQRLMKTQPTEEDKQFKCDTCDRAYIHYTSLKRHLNYQCNKEPQFYCPYCRFKTKLKDYLHTHIRYKHCNE